MKKGVDYEHDLENKKYGKLTINYCVGSKGTGVRYWHCTCDCGNEVELPRCNIITGHTKSCGMCEIDSTVNGMSDTRLYRIYRHMLCRCYSVNDTHYADYGGRGIKVCNRWLVAFANFYEDMHKEYYSHAKRYGDRNTTLERIDVNGDYELSNCRWATIEEQARNKRNNHMVTYNGETKTLADHIKDCGLNSSTVRNRIHTGWDDVDALSTPVKSTTPIYYKGIPLAKYCREFGLNYKLIHGRIRHGWDIDSAVNAPKGVTYSLWLTSSDNIQLEFKTKYMYGGMTVYKYCKEHELPYNTVQYRISHGWDVDSAVEAPKGTQYKTWLKIKSGKNFLDNTD